MRKIIFIVLLIFLVSTTTAYAGMTRGYYDYEGTIGKEKIVMSLYIDENIVKGSYFYDKFRKVIDVDGTLKNGQLNLKEYDMKKKETSVFTGRIQADDSVKGIWKNSKSQKSKNFILKSVSILALVQYGHRYASIGTEDDKSVEFFVLQLQNYIKKNNKEKIAEMVAYPINIYINNRIITINDKADFMKNYNKIINPELKKALSNAYTKYMFANYQGVMFGTNTKNIWINNVKDSKNKTRLLIIAFNN